MGVFEIPITSFHLLTFSFYSEKAYLSDYFKTLKTSLSFVSLVFLTCFTVFAQEQRIIVGAEQVEKYLPIITGKKIALVANHTSAVGKIHLVDTLLNLGLKIDKIFCPEHGFRGDNEAGESIKNHVDIKTGLPVVSLYGSNKKPFARDLQNIDIVIFDMQDVGVRFYTYISTMHYVMEACAEQNLPLIILDRPNPNGFYVDGPVLDTANSSFIGLHPVPIVHGMTIGEYAQMINGEKWLKSGVQCSVTIIPCINYTHSMVYNLPIKPSPNLPNQVSVYLYPSLGLFEGTNISVGRGTDFPFQVFGSPMLPVTGFFFTPTEKPGASKNPPYKNERCNGIDLRDYNPKFFLSNQKLNLEWLLFAYKMNRKKSAFFNSYFENLSGTKMLRYQIEKGLSEDSIRSTWKPQLDSFMKIREKYLLYPDFK